jgi:predicted nucleotidyltransferase
MGPSKSTDRIVKQFTDEILPKIRDTLKPNLVIIFGSRARGEASEESDIDVIIVSDHFRGKPFLGRMPMMIRTFRFPWSVDYLCYSPEEFSEIKSTSVIIQEALQHGIEATA